MKQNRYFARFVAFCLLWFNRALVFLRLKTANPIPTEERYLKPKSDQAWNPILKYPRNESCYCGSGVKYKKCHFLSEPLTLPANGAVEASKLIKTIKAVR